MNNEEKILEILAQMQGDMASMKGDIADLKSNQESMQTTLTRVAVTQENVVLPKIQLLAEGHTAIQEQIRHISVIDRMEDDISTLKAAVKYLSSELEHMKQAM